MERTPPVAVAGPVVVPAAAWILRQIASGPGSPLTAALVGPGGSGKSALIKTIAAAYERAGVRAIHISRDSDLSSVADGLPILVDDAHRMDTGALNALRERGRAVDMRMVVAYRPWPRPEGLSSLGAQMSLHHSPVVLGHLGREEVAEHVARRVDCEPPDALVALVYEQSGGLPMFVNLVTQAMVDTGRFDPRHPDRFRRPQRVSVSPGLAERLRYLLETLDPRIYGVLEAMALGAPLDAEVFCPLLGADATDLAETVEAARATGLLTDAGELIVFVRNLVLRLIPVLRSRNMQRRLAEIQVENGGPVLEAGRQLAKSRATGARASAVMVAAADEALRTSPHLAVELYEAAVLAGGSAQDVVARRAQAAALAGDPTLALRLADEVLSAESSTVADRRRAVLVSAAVLARRGFAARTAELYQSLSKPGSVDALLAVPALLAAGELDQAREVLAAAPPSGSDAPTLTAPALRLLAAGVLESVAGNAAVALSQLVQAAGLVESAGDALLLPYSPAELVAAVATQCGEVALAEATLGHAVATRLGGGFAHARHLLLHGWHALERGAPDTARAMLDRIRTGGSTLEPGDELLAAALESGLARQDGDTAALAAAFTRGRTALIRHPADLYLVRPLGELAVAAAALDERASITPHLELTWALLAKLGNPPLWTVPLHWSELQAELTTGDLDAAQRQASALADLGAGARHAVRFADAADCWLRVARREGCRPAEIRTAATGLRHVGHGWDGMQLVAAAAHAVDRKDGAALMAFARDLSDRAGVPREHANPPPVEPADAGEDDVCEEPVSAVPAPAPQLSKRELEVGRLILAGLTHKQIGARLFISAKTVEHHVARMRNRLGVDGRNELFGMLQLFLGDVGPAPEPTGEAGASTAIKAHAGASGLTVGVSRRH
ncbi:MAG TPA: LuxR C-terminal-related transcriptional regulator [Actinophytocola sp.]|nr:LuxR C-terminal-related transcriptional regulator [Actinophytocola sp.]